MALAPGRDAVCVGKRLKHLIFPGNKMVVAIKFKKRKKRKNKIVFLLRARPEWNSSGLNAPLQLGLLEG